MLQPMTPAAILDCNDHSNQKVGLRSSSHQENRSLAGAKQQAAGCPQEGTCWNSLWSSLMLLLCCCSVPLQALVVTNTSRKHPLRCVVIDTERYASPLASSGWHLSYLSCLLAEHPVRPPRHHPEHLTPRRESLLELPCYCLCSFGGSTCFSQPLSSSSGLS